MCTRLLTIVTAAETVFREDHVSNRVLQVYLSTRRNTKFLSKTISPLIEAVLSRKQPVEVRRP